jgi:cell wall-associated NlpC family hydrolase
MMPYKIPVLSLILLLLSLTSRPLDAGSNATPGMPAETSPVPDRAAVIAFAKQYMGTPYRRAGMDPNKGFDCSGFVGFVFGEFDVRLPRCSREYTALRPALKPEDFRVGDVVVFFGFRDRGHIGHVGIICEANGMKSKFIHASSGKAHSVTISDLGSEGYTRRFYKVIDVIGLRK